jgi:TrmH family RNA methyltransferase
MLSKNQRKQILQLSQKKQRLANGLFVAEGEKVVRELLNSSWVYESLYTTDPSFHTDAEVIRMEEMKQLTHFKTPSPVLGVFKTPPRKEILNESISIVLDGSVIPGT